MSNPFDLLGNDVEDVNDVVSLPREIVKKTTSSKKTDAPPASATKDRARAARPQPTGNDGAFKDKNAGRSANKSRGVDEKPAAKGGKPKAGPKDRQSRSARTDSEKKVKQAGWTADGKDELAAEVEGAEDAAEEIAEDAEPKVAKKSLEEYLKEKDAASTANSQRETRKVESVSQDDIIVKEQEVFIVASKEKKLRSKALKTKTILEFDATFADELPKPERAPRGDRDAPRGGARGGRGPRGGARGGASSAPRGGARAAPKKSEKAPQLTEENFPSLA